MQRADLLRDLVARGTETSPDRCRELAVELGLLASDISSSSHGRRGLRTDGHRTRVAGHPGAASRLALL